MHWGLSKLPPLLPFQILKLLSGNIVVGHAIHNDFKALKYFHPKSLTRDTSKIPLLNRKAGFPENESASLKRLTKQLLHRDIQVTGAGHTCPGAEPGCLFGRVVLLRRGAALGCILQGGWGIELAPP